MGFDAMIDPVEIDGMSDPLHRGKRNTLRVIRGTHEVPQTMRGGVLAIGNFDGVHRGHQALIASTIRQARSNEAPAGVMVFEPHPRTFFQPDAPHFQLTDLDAKIALLSDLGLDLCVVLEFNAALASLPGDQFIADILVRDLGVSHVIVGYDFHFGKGRDGSPETLRRAGERHGFKVSIVEPQSDDGEIYSSTGVRKKLEQGDVAGARQILGYDWFVTGPVASGAGRGAGLGFPTANIRLVRGSGIAHGIYAVDVKIDERRYGGAAYFGSRPTFDDGAPVLEVFIFDYDGDLYDREIKISFVEFLRSDTRFDSADALKTQIAADCEAARTILKKHTPLHLGV